MLLLSNFRWPTLKEICSAYWSDGDRTIKEEIIERVKCKRKVADYLLRLYNQNYYKEDLSFSDMLDFKNVFCIRGEDSQILEHCYLVDEINEILHDEW